MWQSLPKESVPVNRSQIRRYLLVNSTEMFRATSFKCLFKYNVVMYRPIINIISPIIHFSQKRTKPKRKVYLYKPLSFFHYLFFSQCNPFPFLLSSSHHLLQCLEGLAPTLLLKQSNYSSAHSVWLEGEASLVAYLQTSRFLRKGAQKYGEQIIGLGYWLSWYSTLPFTKLV